MAVSGELRKEVVGRSGSRCEYCRLSQTGQEATFHVDHIQPVVSGGKTELSNLALACVSCSLRKGARRTAVDAKTNDEVGLFHPRVDQWDEHFKWRGSRVIGLTATGRATVALLKMNRELVVAIRNEERIQGRHPPG